MVKDILQRCKPIPLYTVLVLSICYFVLQLILSHLTHGLTLLMASHHMLCNIFALGGCIITIKVGQPIKNLSVTIDFRFNNDL